MSGTLYRKYRPPCFDGVIGQDHIVGTLKNQLAAGRIGHAYLFSGSRGVGKTSLARIFSRAINCENPKSAPCGKCPPCLSTQRENSLDIIEIDAASNNGVDDARDLREKIKYPPINGKYKVDIIDEDHMLTGSALNALLKTLEEPPAHAVFILATTEPHKLPATILSRCLRFDFRLVSMKTLSHLVAKIYDSEGKEYEPDALNAICAAAEGSVRDALSIADMCMGLSKHKLTAKEVSLILGTGDEKTIELLERINSGDIKTALVLINDLAIAGKSMNAAAKELASLARDLMVAKTAPTVLETTDERKEKLVAKAQEFSISHLAALITLFSETENLLRYAPSPRIAMEAAIVRAVKLYSLDLAAIDERILRLEKGVGGQGSGVREQGGECSK
jgi:DNA polymerase-3 subunit gamma/tau